MKRALFAALLASFALAATPSPSAAQAAAPHNVTGDWVVQITGDQLLAGTLHLSQVGTTVIGSAETPHNAGVLQMSGTFSGLTLSGKWRAPKGNVGWFTLNFNAKGTSFNGQWGYGGRKPNGTLVARMLVPTAF
ncbi:MAG TPA: hypothetical protein VMU38_02025 [Candidatus Binatia bacterium]|nr:hypothetical protein [Candidatus Binatia bacterium]